MFSMGLKIVSRSKTGRLTLPFIRQYREYFYRSSCRIAFTNSNFAFDLISRLF